MQQLVDDGGLRLAGQYNIMVNLFPFSLWLIFSFAFVSF